jgi:integron integrase
MNVEQSNLLERVRQAVKQRYLSVKTETAYVNHIRRFLEFCGSEDLTVRRAEKIRVFLRHLRQDEHLAASTQNQARCALLFLYRDVLGQKLSERFDKIKRAPLPGKPHVVFTPEEAKAVLAELQDAPFLIAALMYGSGLRLSEAVALRVGDIDFSRGEIVVRGARTGKKERTTILPKLIIPALRRHLVKVRFIFEDDCLSGFGKAYVPPAILRQFPDAGRQWRWHYVFPAAKLSPFEDGGALCRYHLAESTVQKAVSGAIEKARIYKHGGCQILRYSFAARLFEKNHNVRTIQNLLGHKNLKTTMSYLTFNDGNAGNVLSPLDS